MLQVIIHDRDVPSARLPESGDEGIVLPEVASQVYAYDVWIGAADRFDDAPGVVRRAVIDQNDFVVAGSRVESFADGFDQRFKAVFASIDGNDYRQVRLKQVISIVHRVDHSHTQS